MHRPEEKINVDDKMSDKNVEPPIDENAAAGIHLEGGSNEDEILVIDDTAAEHLACEFCNLTFKKRLAHATHVNKVHPKYLVSLCFQRNFSGG